MTPADLKKKRTSSYYESTEIFRLMESDLEEAEKGAIDLDKASQSLFQDQSLRQLLEISNAMNSWPTLWIRSLR
jgi:hypothetical protein